MAKVIYKDGAKDVTIEKCMTICALGVAIYIEDGKDVVFEPDLA